MPFLLGPALRERVGEREAMFRTPDTLRHAQLGSKGAVRKLNT